MALTKKKPVAAWLTAKAMLDGVQSKANGFKVAPTDRWLITMELGGYHGGTGPAELAEKLKELGDAGVHVGVASPQPKRIWRR